MSEYTWALRLLLRTRSWILFFVYAAASTKTSVERKAKKTRLGGITKPDVLWWLGVPTSGGAVRAPCSALQDWVPGPQHASAAHNYRSSPWAAQPPAQLGLTGCWVYSLEVFSCAATLYPTLFFLSFSFSFLSVYGLVWFGYSTDKQTS